MHHITTKRGRIDKLEDGKYLQNDVVVTFNKLEDAKSLQIFGEQTTSKFNGDWNLGFPRNCNLIKRLNDALSNMPDDVRLYAKDKGGDLIIHKSYKIIQLP